MSTAIVWFRRDLRIEDNPAMLAACRSSEHVLPVYIHAPGEEGDWPPGGASRWWSHHALESLQSALKARGLPLVIRTGSSRDVLHELARECGASSVHWNRRYEPEAIKRDAVIKTALRENGIEALSYCSSLLWEPHTVKNRSGLPFRVFTPFWKHLQSLPVEAPASSLPKKLSAPARVPLGLAVDDLNLRSTLNWDAEFMDHWDPTLAGASNALEDFLDGAVSRYTTQRDHPAVSGTSRLSPYLQSGQLSPRQVWAAAHASGAAASGDGYKFLSEIGWREFAYHLLFHFPHTTGKPLSASYEHFPWEPDPRLLCAWQRGQTGYPIVDAGMRELWRTGWMHNRVRMVVASVLVKHLLQPWQDGARWFWDTLVDADLASNTMGWQWSAGSGADAAPYFRIFNPMLQGGKFDKKGVYVRRYVPELKHLPDKYIHAPWEAPEAVLREAGVTLGKDYPMPVIEHRAGRQRALAALAMNKQLNETSREP